MHRFGYSVDERVLDRYSRSISNIRCASGAVSRLSRPADLAPVGGFDLHLPSTGLIVGFHAVAAKAQLTTADDLMGIES